MKKFFVFLRQLFPPIQRAPAKNVANIGENVQIGQFAQGSNILQFQIGAFVFPVRTLLALVAVAAIAALGVWWLVTPGQMSQGGSAANVAIVEFGARDAQSRVTHSAQGAYLADWLYNRLKFELADLPETTRPQFWHLATSFDLSHLFEKRLTAPIQNEQDSERVAQQVGASIVIYGDLVEGTSVEAFVPQLYVAQKKGEADELTGSQQLGQPIPLPNPINDEYLATYLQPLGRALVWFSRGLQQDLNGRYDLAYQIFQQGEQNLADWDEQQGKEVLYYFIGREALFLANCESDAQIVFKPQANVSGVERALNEAEKNFARARQIAERDGRVYARATLGLGQVAFQRAQRQLIPPEATTAGQCRINVSPMGAPRPCPPRTPPNMDAAALNQAREYISQAITLFDRARAELPQPAPARLDAKFSAARATADTLLGTVELLQQNPAVAETLARNASATLQTLTQTTPADDRRTRANVYLALGSAYALAGSARHAQNDAPNAIPQFENAASAYNACVNMIPADDPDAFLRALLLPNCFCARADTQKILDGLR